MQAKSALTIYEAQQEEARAVLCKTMPQKVLLDAITFESDSLFSEQEFFYLFGLKPYTWATPEEISKGIFYLFCKNKFEYITLQFAQVRAGVAVHVVLKSFWTVSHVAIKGITLGKDAYRHYYALNPGQQFERATHHDSIQNMKNMLRQEGFFNAIVRDHLDYDEPTKTVAVCLELHKGGQFTIDCITTTICAKNGKISARYAELEQEIQQFFLTRLSGQKYTKLLVDAVTQESRHYIAQKGFLDISIELEQLLSHTQSTISLAFIIEVHPKKEFVFFGNQFFSHEQLSEMLCTFGPCASLLPASFLAEELVAWYKKKGFLHATVETKEEDDRYFFIIHEGVRARIAQIELIGIDYLDGAEVRKHCFNGLVGGNYFDHELLQEGIRKLADRYALDGFCDFSFMKQELICMQEGYYRLALHFDQGEKSYLVQVQVDGYDDSSLDFSFVQPSENGPPSVFNVAVIETQKKQIEQYMHTQGYVHIELSHEVMREKNEVTLCWHINAHKQRFHFGKAVVVSSKPFSFEHVVREMAFKEGDAWDERQFSSSLLQLKGLGIFDQIHLYPAHKLPAPYERPVILAIHPDDPFEFRMRSGLGLEYAGKAHTYRGITYQAGGTALVKNPFGQADLFGIDVDYTRFEKSFSVQYWRPWLFSMPIRTHLRGYNNHFFYPGVVDGRRNLYEVIQQGALMSLRRTWCDIEGAVTLGVEWMETRMSNECGGGMFSRQVARALNFEPLLLDKKIPYVVSESTLFIDRLDNKLYPTRGSLGIFSLKIMVPLQHRYFNAYFVKFLAQQSLYVSLRSFVLATRIRFGHIFHRVFKNVMPSERFYLGGVNSVRSYETDRCPPLGEVQDEQGKICLVPQGGKTMCNFNGELRFPVYKMIAGAVFQDLGFLTGGSLRNVVKEDLLAGTGFGLRFITPIGPLRFDIAWKWHVPDKRLSSYAWFLTLGTIF